MAPPMNFTLLVVVFGHSTHSNIQITKEVNIHNNIQKINLIKFSKKYFLPYQIFFYNNRIKIISRKLIISSSTINQFN